MTRNFPGRNIYASDWTEQESPRGGVWKYLDLSGEHLGMRLEELAQGETSSLHHFHTTEEEHVIVLEGEGILVLGDDEHVIRRGDHFWFKAGEETGHHLVNRKHEPLVFLIVGERNEGDVVMYPDAGVALVKALGFKRYNYTDRK